MSLHNEEVAIKVEGVHKTFKLPHEKHSSLKGLFLSSFSKKSYEVQHALKDINFEVKKGEFFAIVGRNGCGKSTLLKCIAGVYNPNQGSIKINGSLVPFIELGVGFNPELTGRDNVYLNGALIGFNRQQVDAMYNEIVKFAELEDFMDQKLKNYSSGMQVRLAFSIAIRAKSDILLLDEVLAVGDAAFQQKCFNYFEDLKRNKRTVVLVSHDMNAVNRFCTRAIYIDNGEIIYDGDPVKIADLYREKNIAASNKERATQPENAKATKSKVSVKVGEYKDDVLPLIFKYKSEEKGPMYIGFSVIREGRSVAELTTPLDMELRGDGKITYNLDTSLLNPGEYEVAVVLCTMRNRQLVNVGTDKPRFFVKGNDITRGAALKLEHNWK